jgi:hypothetical protein
MDLEPKHNQAIREEIGHRLRGLLTPEPTRLPPQLRQLALRLDQQYLGGDDSPPMVPEIDVPDDPAATSKVDPLSAWLHKLRMFRRP